MLAGDGPLAEDDQKMVVVGVFLFRDPGPGLEFPLLDKGIGLARLDEIPIGVHQGELGEVGVELIAQDLVEGAA